MSILNSNSAYFSPIVDFASQKSLADPIAILAEANRIVEERRITLDKLLEDFRSKPGSIKSFHFICQQFLERQPDFLVEKLAPLKKKMRQQYRWAKIYVPVVMPHTFSANGLNLYTELLNMAMEFLAQFAYYPNPKYGEFVKAAIGHITAGKAKGALFEILKEFMKTLNHYGLEAIKSFEKLPFDIKDVRKRTRRMLPII